MREDDKKIAEWLGHKVNYSGADSGWAFAEMADGSWIIPDYSTSDADAITLLPVLVERGYQVGLVMADETDHQWACMIGKKGQRSKDCIEIFAPTIALAITTAVLALIEREGNHETI